MSIRLARTAIFATAIVAAAPAARAAEACPAGTQQLETIVRAVQAAPTCATAYKIAEACAFGSSADVQTTAIVIGKCQGRMSPSQRVGYDRAAKDCAARHAGKDGTMYQAMAAFCAAGAAVKAAGASGR